MVLEKKNDDKGKIGNPTIGVITATLLLSFIDYR